MGTKRKIIKIDEARCNGCGQCIPNCPEGALQMIDNKARLVSDLFCDGLGACIGNCPEGAIAIEERDAEPYDEKKVMRNIVKQGPNTIKAHLKHLKDHGEKELYAQATAYLEENNIAIPEEKEILPEAHGGGCPGVRAMTLDETASDKERAGHDPDMTSELNNWPVQLMLVPPTAPYLNHADILIAADCVPFAYANFHRDFVKDRVVIIACPKLDDTSIYREKLTSLFKANDINSIKIAHMQVPCCFGLTELIKQARAASGKTIPVSRVNISLQGVVIEEKEV